MASDPGKSAAQIGGGAGDLLGGIGSVFQLKYEREQQRLNFWAGVRESQRVANLDYGALYRRMDEEALGVSQEISMLANQGRSRSGSLAATAAGAGLSGVSLGEEMDDFEREALVQEGVVRRNLLIVQNQIGSEIEAARMRARGRMIEAAGGPTPNYFGAYLQTLTGAAKLGGAIAGAI